MGGWGVSAPGGSWLGPPMGVQKHDSSHLHHIDMFTQVDSDVGGYDDPIPPYYPGAARGQPPSAAHYPGFDLAGGTRGMEPFMGAEAFAPPLHGAHANPARFSMGMLGSPPPMTMPAMTAAHALPVMSPPPPASAVATHNVPPLPTGQMARAAFAVAMNPHPAPPHASGRVTAYAESVESTEVRVQSSSGPPPSLARAREVMAGWGSERSVLTVDSVNWSVSSSGSNDDMARAHPSLKSIFGHEQVPDSSMAVGAERALLARGIPSMQSMSSDIDMSR